MKYSALFFLFASLIIACDNQKTSDDSTVKEGEKLAKMYCASCHKFPEPELLDKQTWKEHMLPRMGYFLGIYKDPSERMELIEKGEGGKEVEALGLFPKEAVISKEEWQAIRTYYLELSPDSLIIPEIKLAVYHNQFKVVIPAVKYSPPSSTLVKFSNNGHIYFGDALTGKLVELDDQFNEIKSGNVTEGAVWLEESEESLWLTVMGSFSPEDAQKGMVLSIPKDGAKQARIAADKLRRPVHTSYDDLNNDGLMDFVVCEFGKWTGRLSMFLNDGNGEFNQSTLINQTGAVKSYIKDFNGDGLQDVIALFGQGNESIYILYNLGEGKFKMDQVLQFSPSHGSCYFNLFDYNGDGFDDIIYCAGDNADFTPIMKPYHGIYIFENDGENNFKEVFFYQMNGAYAAIPSDFDQDGDLDIAAISFFPDFERSPENGFIYLEGQGGLNFKASTLIDPSLGRWIVMDAKDHDNDGDLDLILGSLAFEVVPENDLLNQWIEKGIPFIILENTHN